MVVFLSVGDKQEHLSLDGPMQSVHCDDCNLSLSLTVSTASCLQL